jgi:hypothetical protein
MSPADRLCASLGVVGKDPIPPLSDTVTLIAGVLLTSVGLLALLPYVLRQGWRTHKGRLAVDSGFHSMLAALEAFGEPLEPEPLDDELPRATVGAEELEELLAHLFSLRMTVSEIAGEVQDAHEIISGVLPNNISGDDAVDLRSQGIA